MVEINLIVKVVREAVLVLLDVIKVMRRVDVVFAMLDAVRVVFFIIVSRINPSTTILYITLLLILLLVKVVEDEYAGVFVKYAEAIVTHYNPS